MKPTHPNSREYTHDPLTAALESALMLERQGPEALGAEPPRPFVTISRQAWAGGQPFGYALRDRLNSEVPEEGPRWTYWDDELVQKVSRDHALAQAYVAALEDQPHGWFAEFLGGLSFGGHDSRPDEFKVYRRVASTIRALARAGHAIIVGRGGAFIAGDLPGGVHLRLVAPFAFRARLMSQHMNVSQRAGADAVAEIDQNRSAFFRRYWPGKSTDAESFTMTLNSSKMSIPQMVACVAPMLAPVDSPSMVGQFA